MPDVVPNQDLTLAELRRPYPDDSVGSQPDLHEALQDSETRWRSLVQTAPSFIFMMDLDGTILFSNRLLDGVQPEAIYGRKGWEFVPEEYVEMVKAVIAGVVSSLSPATIEHPAGGPGGGTAWYTSTIGPVIGKEGVIAVTAVSTDITPQKQAQDARDESDERLRTLVTVVSDAVMVFDGEGKYLEVLTAPQMSPLLPVPADEMKGKRLHDVLSSELADYFLKTVRETIATQKPLTNVSPYEAAGRQYSFEIRFLPLRLPDGTDAVVCATQDVTERAAMEAELQQLREETEDRAAAQYKQGNEYNLSFREITVLNLIAGGKSDRQIAETLNIAASTVNKHVSNILSKMEVSRRAEAVARAVRDKII